MNPDDVESMQLKLCAVQIHMGWLFMAILSMGAGHLFRDSWDDEGRAERLRLLGESLSEYWGSRDGME